MDSLCHVGRGETGVGKASQSRVAGKVRNRIGTGWDNWWEAGKDREVMGQSASVKGNRKRRKRDGTVDGNVARVENT